jgi:hypothetical protein
LVYWALSKTCLTGRQNFLNVRNFENIPVRNFFLQVYTLAAKAVAVRSILSPAVLGDLFAKVVFARRPANGFGGDPHF